MWPTAREHFYLRLKKLTHQWFIQVTMPEFFFFFFPKYAQPFQSAWKAEHAKQVIYLQYDRKFARSIWKLEKCFWSRYNYWAERKIYTLLTVRPCQLDTLYSNIITTLLRISWCSYSTRGITKCFINCIMICNSRELDKSASSVLYAVLRSWHYQRIEGMITKAITQYNLNVLYDPCCHYSLLSWHNHFVITP